MSVKKSSFSIDSLIAKNDQEKYLQMAKPSNFDKIKVNFILRKIFDENSSIIWIIKN